MILITFKRLSFEIWLLWWIFFYFHNIVKYYWNDLQKTNCYLIDKLNKYSMHIISTLGFLHVSCYSRFRSIRSCAITYWATERDLNVLIRLWFYYCIQVHYKTYLCNQSNRDLNVYCGSSKFHGIHFLRNAKISFFFIVVNFDHVFSMIE